MARKDPGPRSMVRFIGRVIKGSKPSKYSGFVEPALATLRTKPPTCDDYVHEIKFDSYRIQAHLRSGMPYLYTRSGLNWTRRFPTVAMAFGKAGTGFTNSMILELARLLKPVTLANLRSQSCQTARTRSINGLCRNTGPRLSTATSRPTDCFAMSLFGDFTPAERRRSRSSPNSGPSWRIIIANCPLGHTKLQIDCDACRCSPRRV